MPILYNCPPWVTPEYLAQASRAEELVRTAFRDVSAIDVSQDPELDYGSPEDEWIRSRMARSASAFDTSDLLSTAILTHSDAFYSLLPAFLIASIHMSERDRGYAERSTLPECLIRALMPYGEDGRDFFLNRFAALTLLQLEAISEVVATLSLRTDSVGTLAGDSLTKFWAGFGEEELTAAVEGMSSSES